MDERGVRRSLTLSDHMATDSDEQMRDNNLKVRDEAGGGERRSLGAAIASERREAFAASGSSGSRTLKDIIREEHAMSRGEFPLGPGGAAGSGNWRSFKDRLRIRRDGDGDGDEGGVNADPPLSIGLPTSPVFGRQMTNRRPEMPPAARASFRNIGYTPPAAVAAQAEAQSAPPEDPPAEDVGGGEDPGAPAVEPVRMSLMALLADGGDNDDDEDDDDDDDDDEDGDDDGEEVFGKEGMYVCCVCMVRHKGAAFIPCGHTFCRLCSRELWVSRGNCPLCNGYILEILDIF